MSLPQIVVDLAPNAGPYNIHQKRSPSPFIFKIEGGLRFEQLGIHTERLVS